MLNLKNFNLPVLISGEFVRGRGSRGSRGRRGRHPSDHPSYSVEVNRASSGLVPLSSIAVLPLTAFGESEPTLPDPDVDLSLFGEK